jgi:hypothetical protein
MENEDTSTSYDASDVSALLSLDVDDDVQPQGNTWEEFMDSLYHLTTSIMREAHSRSGLVPYRTIPHPVPVNLLPSIIAMKTQYTLRGRMCSVRIGVNSSERRLGVFATERLEPGNVVTVLPVDAIFIQCHGGVFLSTGTGSVDPKTVLIRNTRHDDIFIASSLLYFCPERCGHLIHWGEDPNVSLTDVLGGMMYIIEATRTLEPGEELILSK